MLTRIFKGGISFVGYAYRGCVSLTRYIVREAYRATHSQSEAGTASSSVAEKQDGNKISAAQLAEDVEEGEIPQDEVSGKREEEMEEAMMKRGEQLERLLKPLLEGSNLNWELADRYLKLLSSSLGSTSRYRIMTSSFFKALDGQNNTKMKKYLNDQGVRLAHVILIPILANHRWYFAKVENEVVTLYDCNEEIEDRYRTVPPVRDICKAVKDENIEIQVSAEFPRMHTSRDSGIFMLMGIRDVVQEQGWTFTEEEVKQKRVQIAQELLEGKLTQPQQ